MTPLQPDTFYHIYNRANGRENLFDEKQNYHFFLEKYKKYISPIAETWAYCLMPNHFHLLVEIRSEEELKRRRRRKTFPKFETLEKLEESELEKLVSRQFANLFSSYTQAFHKLYQRTGSLFQKNFKRKEIHSGEYLNGGHIIHPYQSCTSRLYRYNRRSAPFFLSGCCVRKK